MELLAIRLGWQKTPTKSLVIAPFSLKGEGIGSFPLEGVWMEVKTLNTLIRVGKQ